MGLQTMSNIGEVTEELSVGRGDPVYMAHAYLTKVPVTAITPFIERYAPLGGLVIDPFAGSGMTGVAAAMVGRSAQLFDISVLGRHIGSNYVNLVDAEHLIKQADDVVRAAKVRLGDVYAVPCEGCGQLGQLSKSVWSVLVRCDGCQATVSYYEAMRAAGWRKADMACPGCGAGVSTRNAKVGEAAALDHVSCGCCSKQREQAPTAPPLVIDVESLAFPRVDITPDRQMYQASALGKSGLTTVASFYSPRNLAVLTELREQIRQVSDPAIAEKLLFSFTATLTRASKRYQWSPARPLNAANANYYVAPVFYEWNVYELFQRKVVAVTRSDDYVRAARHQHVPVDSVDSPDVQYRTASAEAIPLADASVDYVFTDPPFGSNLFYADMALFQEAWLDGFTDVTQEAVIDRSTTGARTADRYERLLTAALSECRRVLKPCGHVSMVFGNSSGKVWALVQRAIDAAGLEIVPEALVVLNKGQRSVKGLASGFEHVATLDLIITMRAASEALTEPERVQRSQLVELTREIAQRDGAASPSHLYLELLRQAVQHRWRLDDVNLRTVTETLLADGWTVESKTGRLHSGSPSA